MVNTASGIVRIKSQAASIIVILVVIYAILAYSYSKFGCIGLGCSSAQGGSQVPGLPG